MVGLRPVGTGTTCERLSIPAFGSKRSVCADVLPVICKGIMMSRLALLGALLVVSVLLLGCSSSCQDLGVTSRNSCIDACSERDYKRGVKWEESGGQSRNASVLCCRHRGFGSVFGLVSILTASDPDC